jgi:hypothetical protein
MPHDERRTTQRKFVLADVGAADACDFDLQQRGVAWNLGRSNSRSSVVEGPTFSAASVFPVAAMGPKS